METQWKGNPMWQGGEDTAWCNGHHMMYISQWLELGEVKLLTDSGM
jgi:hypothetical protein